MKYSDLDVARLNKMELAYGVKCVEQPPFSPADIVEWTCGKNHSWKASYIEVQIDDGCFQCMPGDIKFKGNGSFAQGMSKTLSDLAVDFDQNNFRNHVYHHDASLHIALASFFFTAVKFEFVLKATSAKHPKLGLREKGRFCFSKSGKEYNTIELIERMSKLGIANIGNFVIQGVTKKKALDRYEMLTEEMQVYVTARNKIAHGYSKYPLTRRGNYNVKIADLIKSFGQSGLSEVYTNTQKFLDISDVLIDLNVNKGELGNRILTDLYYRL